MIDFPINIAGVLFFIGEFVVVPLLLVGGWIRWLKKPKERTLFPILSLAGFSAASASALLAVAAVLRKILSGADYFSPLIGYRWGYALSFVACAFAIAALWRPGRLRWHALVCGAGTLFFWYMMGIPD